MRLFLWGAILSPNLSFHPTKSSLTIKSQLSTVLNLPSAYLFLIKPKLPTFWILYVILIENELPNWFLIKLPMSRVLDGWRITFHNSIFFIPDATLKLTSLISVNWVQLLITSERKNRWQDFKKKIMKTEIEIYEMQSRKVPRERQTDCVNRHVMKSPLECHNAIRTHLSSPAFYDGKCIGFWQYHKLTSMCPLALPYVTILYISIGHFSQLYDCFFSFHI